MKCVSFTFTFTCLKLSKRCSQICKWQVFFQIDLVQDVGGNMRLAEQAQFVND